MPAFPTQISRPPPAKDRRLTASRSWKSQVVSIMAAASSTIDHTNIETLTFQRSTIESRRQMVAEMTAREVDRVDGKVASNTATVTTRILVNMRRQRITGIRKQRRHLRRRLMNPTTPATLTFSPRKIFSTWTLIRSTKILWIARSFRGVQRRRRVQRASNRAACRVFTIRNMWFCRR